MAKQPKDIAASVRQRLLNLARAEGQLFDVVLVAFGLERLVYRLSVSEYRDRFVLKGGMLVTLWTADTGRFTRDIDFLAFGSDEEAELKTAFSRILAIDGGDGLVYDVASLTAVAGKTRFMEGCGLGLMHISGARAYRSPWTSASAMPWRIRNSRLSMDPCSTSLPHQSVPTPRQQSSPRSFRPWWRWAWRTAG